MNSADIYEKSLQVSQAEVGTETYDRMQETYRDSMEGRLNALSATIEGIFVHAFNTDDFYGLIDAATALAETFDNLIQSIGGGSNALMGLGAIITKVFSNNIAQGIGNFVQNRQTNRLAAENINNAVLMARQDLQGQGLSSASQRMQTMDRDVNSLKQHFGVMSQEQLDANVGKMQRYIAATTEAEVAEQKFVDSLRVAERALKSVDIGVESGRGKLQLYQEILNKLFEARADGVPITKELLAQDEMFKNLQTDTANLVRELVELTQIFGTNAIESEEFGLKVEQLSERISKTIAFTKELMTAENLDVETKAKLQSVSDALISVQNKNAESMEQLNSAIMEIFGSYERFEEMMQVVVNQGKEVTTNLMQQREAFAQAAAAQSTTRSEVVGAASVANVQTFAHSLTNLASAGMTAVFAMQSLTNIFKIIDNEDLTFAEKAEQLAMNIAMVAAMGVPAFTQTKAAIGDLKISILG